MRVAFAITLTVILSACASTPTTPLTNHVTPQNEALLGNWMCGYEIALEKNARTLTTTMDWQEKILEDGRYIGVGVLSASVEGEPTNTATLFVDGRWFANHNEIRLHSHRARAIPNPGATPSFTKAAKSAKFNKSLLKPQTDDYMITDGIMTRTSQRKEMEATCATWEEWEKICAESALDNCGTILEAEYFDEITKTVFQ